MGKANCQLCRVVFVAHLARPSALRFKAVTLDAVAVPRGTKEARKFQTSQVGLKYVMGERCLHR